VASWAARTVRLLGAVLAIQASALSAGAQVQQHISDTQVLLGDHMEALREEVLPPIPPVSSKSLPQIPEGRPSLPCREDDIDTHDEALKASRCRALLLEVIRRAAHDWVLYRTTSKLELRQLALGAHTWLFEERPGHPWWALRHKEGEPFLAFLNICETLDLSPEKVRSRVREMTVRDIVTAGRPAERRHRQSKGRLLGIEDYESPPELAFVSQEEYFPVTCYGSSST